MRHAPEPKTPFVEECERIMAARLAATTRAEKDDAEWGMNYLFQMHRTGRLDEYFAAAAASRESA